MSEQQGQTETAETAPRSGGIPPHILWPGIVVAILLMSVLANVVLVVAATRDGGAQVEADYYQRALHWDEDRADREASDALGWRTDLVVQAPQTPGGPTVLVTIADAHGQPVDGLAGAMMVRHTTQAEWKSLELTPIVGSHGQYTAAATFDRPGLWDFTVNARRNGEHFVQTTRRELSL